jgi:hypothetical protein
MPHARTLRKPGDVAATTVGDAEKCQTDQIIFLARPVCLRVESQTRKPKLRSGDLGDRRKARLVEEQNQLSARIDHRGGRTRGIDKPDDLWWWKEVAIDGGRLFNLYAHFDSD